MDYPPWLPEPEYSRSGMLLALARCVYEAWLRPEPHLETGEILTFDNLCSGDLEKVADVLQRTGFISYIDGHGRRSVFSVKPDAFSGLANAAQHSQVTDDEIKDAVLRLATGDLRANLEIKALAKMIESSS